MRKGKRHGWCMALCWAVIIGSPVALALDPNPAPPKKANLPTLPKVTCANLGAEIARMRAMVSDHNQATAGYMDEVVMTMDKWHKRLVNFEGKAWQVPAGEFAPIKKGLDEISEVQSLVWENHAVVDERFDEILEVLPSCVVVIQNKR